MTGGHPAEEPTWLHGHSHEPNPVAPVGDGSFLLGSGLEMRRITLEALRALPYVEIKDCYIVSTGHGTSGPFRFGGARLSDLLTAHLPDPQEVHAVDVVSADGFGTRLPFDGLRVARPPLLAWTRDGEPLTRAGGLVRLIVPTESDDALRQVKWIARITPAP